MNWLGTEFSKFKAAVEGFFSAHAARIEALEAKVKELESKLLVDDSPAASRDVPVIGG